MIESLQVGWGGYIRPLREREKESGLVREDEKIRADSEQLTDLCRQGV